jgi:hypothetical protein
LVESHSGRSTSEKARPSHPKQPAPPPHRGLRNRNGPRIESRQMKSGRSLWSKAVRRAHPRSAREEMEQCFGPLRLHRPGRVQRIASTKSGPRSRSSPGFQAGSGLRAQLLDLAGDRVAADPEQLGGLDAPAAGGTRARRMRMRSKSG